MLMPLEDKSSTPGPSPTHGKVHGAREAARSLLAPDVPDLSKDLEEAQQKACQEDSSQDLWTAVHSCILHEQRKQISEVVAEAVSTTLATAERLKLHLGDLDCWEQAIESGKEPLKYNTQSWEDEGYCLPPRPPDWFLEKLKQEEDAAQNEHGPDPKRKSVPVAE